ncbi:MAG: hypothetical protein COB46_06995 [Rhodospirillaceae bacterium]|nr:MAG: hypothetical protein COB46_06995 [Rhodospirillaceae bacterium]
MLAVAHASGREDEGIVLVIAAAMPTGTSDTLQTITLSGIPDGAFLNAGTENADGSWSISVDQLTGLILTPPADYSGVININVTATSVAGISVTQALDATVIAVTDQPSLTVSDAVVDVVLAPDEGEEIEGGKGDDEIVGTDGSDEIDGGKGDDIIFGSAEAAGEDPEPEVLDEPQAVSLDINAALTDVDGSETLSLEISGVPTGASLNLGLPGEDGSWLLAGANLSSLDTLELTLPDGFVREDFSLSVKATSVELESGEMSTIDAALNVSFETTETQGDVIFGGKGDDQIFAGAGDDVLDGGHGDDYLSGGAGDDTLIGDKGDDELSGGAGADELGGGKGDDIIGGGAGDDVIDGDAGDDIIDGGTGDDVLRGGSGDDTFVFKAGDGNDFILDLSEKEELRFDGPEFSQEDLTVTDNGDHTATLTFGQGTDVSVTINHDADDIGDSYSVTQDGDSIVVSFDDDL